MNITEILQTLVVWAIPVLLAITLHEAAHAYAANKRGDPTAANLGRFSLNPLRHIDPVGTILMPALLYWATGGRFMFGYAKPVPVLARNLNSPRFDMVLVALAGPMANLLQAVVWLLLAVGLAFAGFEKSLWVEVINAGISVNLVMFAFNLFPLLPLDGGRILNGLLPPNLSAQYEKIEPYGFFITMALVVSNVISDYWMTPVIRFIQTILLAIFSPLLRMSGA